METTKDLQRIARIFNLKADDPMLVLKIGDIVKAKEDKYKKQDFSYYMLKAQNKKLEKQVDNLHNEYAESVGIHEHMMVKNSRDTIRKDLNKALMKNHELNETIRRYQEREFNDKLKKIEGVR